MRPLISGMLGLAAWLGAWRVAGEHSGIAIALLLLTVACTAAYCDDRRREARAARMRAAAELAREQARQRPGAPAVRLGERKDGAA